MGCIGMTDTSIIWPTGLLVPTRLEDLAVLFDVVGFFIKYLTCKSRFEVVEAEVTYTSQRCAKHSGIFFGTGRRRNTVRPRTCYNLLRKVLCHSHLY